MEELLVWSIIFVELTLFNVGGGLPLNIFFLNLQPRPHHVVSQREQDGVCLALRSDMTGVAKVSKRGADYGQDSCALSVAVGPSPINMSVDSGVAAKLKNKIPMEKKMNVYEHPEMEVVMLETKPLLAGSNDIEAGTEGGGEWE